MKNLEEAQDTNQVYKQLAMSFLKHFIGISKYKAMELSS